MDTSAPPEFSAVARFYSTLERIVFGRTLDRARTAFIERLASCRDVLICGEGDGRFLKTALRVAPDARFTVLDVSAGMIERARRRAATVPDAHARVDFRLADVRDSEQLVADRFDAIVTCFFLDCFEGEELRAVVRRLDRSAAANAVWLYSDFRLLSGVVTGPASRSLVATMYGFFRVTARLRTRQLEDVRAEISDLGWRFEQGQARLGGFVASEVWRKTAC